MLAIEPVVPPIKVDESGTARVGGTRVTLDTVVHSFEEGYSPEEIVNHFPVLELADVYAVIAFYLNNREAVEQYLQEQEEEAFEVWRKIQAMPGYYDFRALLRERRRALEEARKKGNSQ